MIDIRKYIKYIIISFLIILLVFLFTNSRINKNTNMIDINSKKIDSIEKITSYRSTNKSANKNIFENIVDKKEKYNTVEDSLIVEMKSNNMKLDSIIKKMKK